ncbi:WGxxGxxG family protein [Ammoniphilus resinae]|uniref:MYXO-CTERM domain-containing protein n=1 Tax=Ammoniphilus resinae TaxID=861532 RepID=A0ABS4GVM7_9BACL|nr:WGxxGxxG family protein [Ammoniphilus resinae]MBP1934328.1 MYXO-CTERM domain-containing protein [Ammoniphilus resinae]
MKKFSAVGLLALSIILLSGNPVSANQYGNNGMDGVNTNNYNNQGTYNNNNYRARTTAVDNDMDWGWLGLLGLVGLAGLRGRNRDPEPDRMR